MKKLIALVLLCTATAAPPLAAESLSIDTKFGSIVLSDNEREVLREHYRAHPTATTSGKALNKGMQKRLDKGKALPPGWQKKIARGERVPDDVWRYHEPLPGSVVRRLPPQPEGVVTVRIDNKILRVIAATHVILDVFDLI